jgi:Ca2+-binding EF-hand superfamily protein
MFAKMDTDGSGRVDLGEFAAAFDIDATDQVTIDLFHLIDVEEVGTVDFKEFVAGLALINEPGVRNRRDLVRTTFDVFSEPINNPAAGRVSAAGSEEMGRRSSGGPVVVEGITKAGMQRMLGRVMPDISAEDADRLFQDADKDESGVITFDEFETFAMMPQHEKFTGVFNAIFHQAADKLLAEDVKDATAAEAGKKKKR